MRTWLAGWSLLLLLCLATTAIAAGNSVASTPRRPWDSVPRSHWAYKEYATLLKAGVAPRPTICFPSVRGPKYDAEHQTLTRYEFAIVTQRAMETLAAQSKAVYPAKHKRLREQLMRRSVQRLATEFKAEIGFRSHLLKSQK